jgi:hypothetical protein
MIKSGISRMRFRPDDIMKDIRKKSKNFISAVMDDVKDVAKDETPVDTGRAQRGWRRKKQDVLNNVEYITYLEDGHSKQAPSGIARPTIKEINKRYRKGKYNAK